MARTAAPIKGRRAPAGWQKNRPARINQAAIAGAFVAIADTGSGIPLADHERISEPFFTTKPAGSGAGLGLSQVFGFARQSGGEIQVESAPGQGSRFTLHLPRLVAPAKAAPVAVVEMAAGARSSPMLRVRRAGAHPQPSAEVAHAPGMG